MANGDPIRRRALLALVLAAVAVRLALLASGPWQHPERTLNPDSPRYLALADNLRDFQTFGLGGGNEGFTHLAFERLRQANGTLPPADVRGLRPESFRTPGYPLFILVTGGSAADVRTTLLVQAVLGGIAVLGVVVIARALGLSKRGMLVAGWLWALHPALVVHDLLIATESAFNTFAIGALSLSALGRSPRSGYLAGALLGLNALVRPVVGLFYLPLALAIDARRHGTNVRRGLAIALLAMLPVIGWATRNMLVGEGFRVSWVGEMNLLFYHAAFAQAEERGEDWQAGWKDRVNGLADKLNARLGPGDDVPRAARQLAIEELLARPKASALVVMKSWVKLAIDQSLPLAFEYVGLRYEASGLMSRLLLREGSAASRSIGTGQALLTIGWLALNGLVALGALVSLVTAARQRRYLLILGCGLPILLFVAITGAVGLERIRLPMMLPLFLLCGALFDAPIRLSRRAVPAQESMASSGAV